MLRLIRRWLGFDALERQLEALQTEARQQANLEAMAGANRATAVRVGGLEVELLPLPPLEWARATRELPSFLLVYAAKSAGGAEVGDADLATFVDTVRGWLRACGRVNGTPITEAQLERLSVPEASLAAQAVSTINGFDETLREFFRVRGGVGGTRPDREAVRVSSVGTPARRSN